MPTRADSPPLISMLPLDMHKEVAHHPPPFSQLLASAPQDMHQESVHPLVKKGFFMNKRLIRFRFVRNLILRFGLMSLHSLVKLLGRDCHTVDYLGFILLDSEVLRD